jgi:hypothetical protein
MRRIGDISIMNRQDAKNAKNAKNFEPPRRQVRQDYSRLLAGVDQRTNGLGFLQTSACTALNLIQVFLASLAPWRFNNVFLGVLGVLVVQNTKSSFVSNDL